MSSSDPRVINPKISKRIHREVRFGSYILGSTLGEGEFGKVKLGWRKDGKQPSQVAIKLIKRENIAKNSESEIKIHREINSLKLLNHPNIVKLVEVMKSGKYIGIVLEYASGGELFDYIYHHKYLKEDVAKRLFAQLVSGIDYMHSKGLVHRDLKLENLLLDKHKNIIISDFGFVNSFNKDKHDYMKTSCGSPCYAAPELVLTQTPYEGKKVDIWSLGIILYAMLSGYLPFDDDPENEDGNDIVKLYHYICKTPLTFPEYVSPLARDLLRKIIVPDPRRRISINDIRSHPWLTQYVNLLSIRQPEWDQIHKESKDSTQLINTYTNNQHAKRFSMVNENTNSDALMMMSKPTNSNIRSYSTTNVVGNSQLYSNPSAPATTSSLANAIVLPTNNDENNVNTTINQNQSPVRVNSKNQNYRQHTKSASMSNSYSSASLALKAMVNDDTNYNYNNNVHSKRNSVISIDSSSPTQISLPKFPQQQQQNVSQSQYLPRAGTYVGTGISTISESPNKPSSSTQERSMLPPSKESNKLPSHKKPRPTSYHPSSISTSLTNSGAILDYLKMPSPITMPIQQFPPNTSTSPIKNNYLTDFNSAQGGSFGNSNSQLNLRRDSAVTPITVSGLLANDEIKNSTAISYLEDRIESMEIQEQNKQEQQNRSYNETLIDSQKRKISDNLSDNTITSRNDQNSSINSHHKQIQKSPTSQEILNILKNKELKERELREKERENKKKNRFSLLSFYSYSSEKPSPHQRSQSLSIQHPPSSSSSSNSRKILEPSNEINIIKNNLLKDQKRVHSVASTQTAGSRKTTSSSKEASAARKVMDFFKRRSMRVN